MNADLHGIVAAEDAVPNAVVATGRNFLKNGNGFSRIRMK